MPKVTIDYKSKTSAQAIILLYTCSDGRLKYYTGEKGMPGKLSKATSFQVNRMIKTIEETAADYKIAGKPLTKRDLSRILDRKYRMTGEVSDRLIDVFNHTVERMRAGKVTTPRTKKRYAPGTLKGLAHTVTLLDQFDHKLTVGNVDLSTYAKFIHFCQDRNYATNYIGGQIKNWKTLGKASGGNAIYDHPEFKIISEDAFDVYLDEKELRKIYLLKLTGPLDRTRDWFILDCYTGLRVSDFSRLSSVNVSRGLITIVNEKTDERVSVPLHPYVRAIYKKHKGFPPRVSDQKLNVGIKKIGRKAGITETIIYSITKGGIRKDMHVQKCDMLSNHTGRRSFVTNLLKQGVPESIVKKLAGIKSSVTISKYNKLSTDEAARIAAKHKFFK
jgi:hypothetical protein